MDVKSSWNGRKRPKLTEEPNDINVSVRGNAYCSCKADGGPDIVWLHKSNKILPTKNLQDDNLMVTEDPDLDEGVNECMPANPAIERKSKAAKMHYLKIQQDKKQDLNLKNVIIKKAETILSEKKRYFIQRIKELDQKLMELDRPQLISHFNKTGQLVKKINFEERITEIVAEKEELMKKFNLAIKVEDRMVPSMENLKDIDPDNLEIILTLYIDDLLQSCKAVTRSRNSTEVIKMFNIKEEIDQDNKCLRGSACRGVAKPKISVLNYLPYLKKEMELAEEKKVPLSRS